MHEETPRANIDNHWFELNSLSTKDFDTRKIDEILVSTQLNFALDAGRVFKRNIEQAIDLAVRPFTMTIEPYIDNLGISLKESANSLTDADFDSLSKCIDFEKLRKSDLTAESLRSNPSTVLDSKQFWSILGKIAEVIISLSKCHEKSIEAENSRLVLSLLKLNPEIIGWFNNLFCSSLCAGWSAYESLSKDLWVSSVNNSMELAHRACYPKGNQEEAKKIDINILFQHKLDLRNQMGAILASRFDFTSEEGIRTAYASALYPKSSSKSVKNSKLYLVEQTRHVIQHRAGIVDSQFIKKTATEKELGSLLSVTAADLRNSLNTVIDAGCDLINQVNTMLGDTTS